MDLYSIRLNQALRNFHVRFLAHVYTRSPVPAKTNRRLLLNDNRNKFGQPFRTAVIPRNGKSIAHCIRHRRRMKFIRVAPIYTGDKHSQN